MVEIMVLIPTRNRPENARRLASSLNEVDVDYKFCVDEDDSRLAEYESSLSAVHIVVDKPNRLGPWLNVASKFYSDFYDVIGFIGDDVMPRTAHWDQQIREAFKPNAVIYPNDGWQGEALPTSVFMDSRIIRKIGYMVYPKLTHLYIDNHWKALGEALGTLTYLPECHLEHLHPFAGKAKTDAVYESANSSAMYSSDGKVFQRYVEEVLANDVRKIL